MVNIYQESKEVEFIPTNWMERAAGWPGLQVYSRPVCMLFNMPCRQNQPMNLNTIERLIRAAFE